MLIILLYIFLQRECKNRFSQIIRKSGRKKPQNLLKLVNISLQIENDSVISDRGRDYLILLDFSGHLLLIRFALAARSWDRDEK